VDEACDPVADGDTGMFSSASARKSFNSSKSYAASLKSLGYAIGDEKYKKLKDLLSLHNARVEITNMFEKDPNKKIPPEELSAQMNQPLVIKAFIHSILKNHPELALK
jgi:hypothetical protein